MTSRLTALESALRALVARVRRAGGYASPAEQAALWEAERALATPPPDDDPLRAAALRWAEADAELAAAHHAQRSADIAYQDEVLRRCSLAGRATEDDHKRSNAITDAKVSAHRRLSIADNAARQAEHALKAAARSVLP
ncbi:MAG TPA: hypothetical protein VFT22_07240 [Kofleriaceae bacterium]|nr:hypothetical protein [Kofleriaceae bacterium]